MTARPAGYLESRDDVCAFEQDRFTRAVEFFDRVVEFAQGDVAASAAMRQRAADLQSAENVSWRRVLRAMRRFVSRLDRRMLRGSLHSSHDRLPTGVRKVLRKLGAPSR